MQPNRKSARTFHYWLQNFALSKWKILSLLKYRDELIFPNVVWNFSLSFFFLNFKIFQMICRIVQHVIRRKLPIETLFSMIARIYYYQQRKLFYISESLSNGGRLFAPFWDAIRWCARTAIRKTRWSRLLKSRTTNGCDEISEYARDASGEGRGFQNISQKKLMYIVKWYVHRFIWAVK